MDTSPQKSCKARPKRDLSASEKEAKSSLQDQNNPLTGEDKIKPILIYEANFFTEAKLVCIDWEISGSQNSSSELRVPIRALHDCGCAKSIMKTSTFMQLARQIKIELKQNSVPTLLVTATGAHQQITGLMDIYIHFEGLNGTSVHIRWRSWFIQT